MIKLKSKKALPDITKRSTAHQLISCIGNYPYSEEQLKTLNEQLQSTGLDLFFHQLGPHLRTSMIYSYKKYTILPQGIYIMAEGKVAYIWLKHKQDRSRKEHLFNLAKAGIFSNMPVNPFRKVNDAFEEGFSCIVKDPYSILQSDGMNTLVLEDVVCLNIPEATLQQTSFYSLKNSRADLCELARLPIIYSNKKFLQINTQLHHFFRRRKYYFHHKFKIENYGIVEEGTLCYRNKNKERIEGTKSTVLFPLVQYEANSAQLRIIEFVENPTLSFVNFIEVKQFYKGLAIEKNSEKALSEYFTNKKKKKEEEEKPGINRYQKSIKEISKLNETQLKKRKKHIATLSREYENYFIVPTEMCRTSLKFAKTQNTQFRKNKDGSLSPTAFSKYYKKGEHKGYTSDLPKIQKSTASPKNISLVERFENISQNLYQKFILAQNRQEK